MTIRQMPTLSPDGGLRMRVRERGPATAECRRIRLRSGSFPRLVHGRRRFLLPLALTVAAVAAPAAAQAKPAWTEYDRPATYEVARDSNVPIEMRDGVVLRANVDRPDAPGRYPDPRSADAVQQGRRSSTSRSAARGNYFVRRGYVVVTVDVRGTGSSSGGQWDSFGLAEQRDGPEVVEWAAASPGRRARSGSGGPSYMAPQPAAHGCATPTAPRGDLPDRPDGRRLPRRHLLRRQPNVAFIPLWLGLVTGRQPDADARRRQPARRPCMALLNHRQRRGQLPARQPAAGRRSAASSPTTGPSGRPRSPLEVRRPHPTCPPSSSAGTTTSSSAASR